MAKDKKTRLLEELIREPSAAASRSEEMTRLGLDVSRSGEDVKLAKGILEDPDAAGRQEQFARLEYPTKLALLELLASEGAGAFLARLQRDEKDKGVGKAIAAAIHKVRAQGMNVADMREKKAVKLDAVQEPPPDSYLSPLDTEGNRLAVLARVSSGGRLTAIHAVVGDTQGLSNLEALGLTRAQYRRFVQMAQAQMGAALARTPADYVAWLISEAARTATTAGLPLPAGFEQARAILGAPASAPEHPLPSVLDRKEVERELPRLVADSARLHDFPECGFWVPEPDALEALQERLKQAEESKVAVTEAQKQDLRLDAAKKSAQEYFDAAKRKLWAGRLEETAYVLAVTERPADAKLAWAAAIALSNGTEVEKIPFATEMLGKIVKHAEKFEREAEKAHPEDLGEVARAAQAAPPEESPIIKP